MISLSALSGESDAVLKFHLLDFFLLFRFFEQVDQIGEPPAGVRSHESTPPLRTFHVQICKLLLHVRE